MAIPRFMQATTKAKQSECKQMLKQIYTMERTYRQESNRYGDNGITIAAGAGGRFPEIGVEIMTSALYTYDIVAAQNTFTARATANLDDDPTVDTWTINEAGILTNTINDVNT
jgi:Tfp pilus assembly protein PilE